LRSFTDVIAFRISPFYVGEPGDVERMFGLLVSGNYFRALGVRPALGRFIVPEEVTRPGGAAVAVISHTLWQSRFGGSADVLGQTLRVNGTRLSVIGVAPPEFQGTVLGLVFEVWTPATMAPVLMTGSRELDDRTIRGYSVLGRLNPSVTRAQAQAETDTLMRQLAQRHPGSNAAVRADVLTFSQSARGPQRLMTTALTILQGMMLLLLLAVCANTANLVLARASSRQREIGVRLALGATPRRIASLILTESIIIALLGSALGAAVAVWGTQGLIVLPLSGLPIKFQTSVDARALAFALTLGVACGAIFGAPSAFQLARVDPQLAFRAGARGAGRTTLRNILMGVQAGLAMIVLILAGLFLRSLTTTRDLDPGFRREGVLLAAYDLSGRNAGPGFERTFAPRLLERLRSIPGIEAAAIAAAVPLDIHGLAPRPFTVDGHARADGVPDRAITNTVTPGYFDVMKIPFVAGRDFAELTDVSAAPQAIVNEAFVRQYLGGGEPVGRRLDARGRRHVIAGVVRNSLYNAFGEPPTPIIYFSYRDAPLAQGEVHVRARDEAGTAAADDIRAAVQAIDPELPVFNVRSLSDHVETNLVFRRIPARMFAVLGPLLLVIAAIGIYAVVAYTVSLRTTEIGVRLALGATGARVIAQFVGQSLGVIGAGAVVGWAIALLVYVDVAGGGTFDLLVFAGVPLLLLSVATFACWLPARRALSLSPWRALRQE
jgi:predicted permease